MISENEISALDWQKSEGLLPAIVQDNTTLRVLMLGYMTQDALHQTIESGEVVFYSRSRQTLWRKGETSGNTLSLRDIKIDCDSDTLLIMAEPKGPTCHKGTQSCFGESGVDLSILGDLAKTVASRRSSEASKSYTSQLFASGIARIAQKVGEEGVEVALAAVSQPEKLAEESADLLYHLVVLLEASNLSLQDVFSVLRQRANKSGAAS
ncbi:MAG: bifunctional phosphoribosyl-AMP cyclohydrolase/phosphoribosyl-ATP diphosphatase HisIE [Pseudomonadota bacterium]